MDRIVLRATSWLTALFGAWLLVSSAVDLYVTKRAESWPTVEGSVTDIRTRKVSVGRFLPLQNWIDATYEYAVDSVRYRADSTLPAHTESSSLTAGSRVTVHYNPENPREVALYPAVSAGLKVYGLSGVFFLVVSVVVRHFADAPATAGERQRKRR